VMSLVVEDFESYCSEWFCVEVEGCFVFVFCD